MASREAERLEALERRVQRMDELLAEVMRRMGDLDLRLRELDDVRYEPSLFRHE